MKKIIIKILIKIMMCLVIPLLTGLVYLDCSHVLASECSNQSTNSSAIEKKVNPVIKDQFPDPNMAKVVAETLGKTINDQISNEDLKLTEISDNTSNRGIKNIDGIEIFKYLSILKLSNNELISYPKVLNQLPQLNVLWLNGNKIESLEGLGDVPLPQLTQLYLSDNKIKNLPVNFINYSHEKGTATEIYLDNNLISSLPADIGKLEKLRVLSISGNTLGDVPESLLSNGTVQEIGLSNNHLVSLPDSFNSKSLIKNLDLSNNQLTSLPNSLLRLKNLSLLSIDGNLLPTNSDKSLSDNLVSKPQINTGNNKKICIKNPDRVYEINSQKDWEDLIDENSISSLLKLNSFNGEEPLYKHDYILADFVDSSNNKTVNISDYISNNKILKSGKLQAKVRATGLGVFPNNSDNAITDDNIIINFSKTKDPVAAKDLTVNYVDELGQSIHASQSIKGNIGDVYDASDAKYKLEISGYTLDTKKTPTNAKGIFTDREQTVIYVYSNVKGSVNIKYLDDQGNKIGPDFVLHGNVNAKFSIKIKEIKGYIYQSSTQDIFGKFKIQPQNITLIYKKNLTPESIDNNTSSYNVVTSKSQKDSSQERLDKKTNNSEGLPSTGEQKGSLYKTIGLIIIILIIGIIYKKKTHKLK